MDIKNMHEMIEALVGCAKAEFDKRGIEQIDPKEMGEVTDMIKDLAEAQYYRTLVEAMDDSEYGLDYDEDGPIEDRKYYRGQPRDAKGRYMSRRRRGYEEMIPEIYHDDWRRDMDKDRGRMYYASDGQHHVSGGEMHGSRTQHMGRSGDSRRGYMETKEINKGNSQEEKMAKMKELERYTKDLAEDVTEMISDASPEEKTMLKSKLQMLITKIG